MESRLLCPIAVRGGDTLCYLVQSRQKATRPSPDGEGQGGAPRDHATPAEIVSRGPRAISSAIAALGDRDCGARCLVIVESRWIPIRSMFSHFYEVDADSVAAQLQGATGKQPWRIRISGVPRVRKYSVPTVGMVISGIKTLADVNIPTRIAGLTAQQQITRKWVEMLGSRTLLPRGVIQCLEECFIPPEVVGLITTGDIPMGEFRRLVETRLEDAIRIATLSVTIEGAVRVKFMSFCDFWLAELRAPPPPSDARRQYFYAVCSPLPDGGEAAASDGGPCIDMEDVSGDLGLFGGPDGSRRKGRGFDPRLLPEVPSVCVKRISGGRLWAPMQVVSVYRSIVKFLSSLGERKRLVLSVSEGSSVDFAEIVCFTSVRDSRLPVVIAPCESAVATALEALGLERLAGIVAHPRAAWGPLMPPEGSTPYPLPSPREMAEKSIADMLDHKTTYPGAARALVIMSAHEYPLPFFYKALEVLNPCAVLLEGMVGSWTGCTPGDNLFESLALTHPPWCEVRSSTWGTGESIPSHVRAGTEGCIEYRVLEAPPGSIVVSASDCWSEDLPPRAPAFQHDGGAVGFSVARQRVYGHIPEGVVGLGGILFEDAEGVFDIIDVSSPPGVPIAFLSVDSEVIGIGQDIPPVHLRTTGTGASWPDMASAIVKLVSLGFTTLTTDAAGEEIMESPRDPWLTDRCILARIGTGDEPRD